MIYVSDGAAGNEAKRREVRLRVRVLSKLCAISERAIFTVFDIYDSCDYLCLIYSNFICNGSSFLINF